MLQMSGPQRAHILSGMIPKSATLFASKSVASRGFFVASVASPEIKHLQARLF